MTRNKAQRIFASALVGFLLIETPLHAEERTDEDRGAFIYGSSCSQLSSFRHREILALVHAAHAENFSFFCSPEGVYSCDDYSALLGGAGALEENGSSGCRYLPSVAL